MEASKIPSGTGQIETNFEAGFSLNQNDSLHGVFSEFLYTQTLEIILKQSDSGSRLFEIAVLSGGISAERDVSLNTGNAVMNALRNQGHTVHPVDPKDIALETYDWTGIDLVYNCLHGEFGEDGQVQRILDRLGICYTGCNAEISEKTFSKYATKKLFREKRIPTPASKLLHETSTAKEINAATMKVGFPLVIKPDRQGSSMGINLVEDKEHLAKALSQAFHLDEYILMEQAVLGTEWTKGYIDEEPLPLIKIETSKTVFDFDAKYVEEETGYSFEFEEPCSVIQRIEKVCHAVIDAVKPKGLTRIDIRLDKMNNPFVLEINTVPGMTEHSLLPKAALQKGISFEELCDRVVQSAWNNSASVASVTET